MEVILQVEGKCLNKDLTFTSKKEENVLTLFMVCKSGICTLYKQENDDKQYILLNNTTNKLVFSKDAYTEFTYDKLVLSCKINDIKHNLLLEDENVVFSQQDSSKCLIFSPFIYRTMHNMIPKAIESIINCILLFYGVKQVSFFDYLDKQIIEIMLTLDLTIKSTSTINGNKILITKYKLGDTIEEDKLDELLGYYPEFADRNSKEIGRTYLYIKGFVFFEQIHRIPITKETNEHYFNIKEMIGDIFKLYEINYNINISR